MSRHRTTIVVSNDGRCCIAVPPEMMESIGLVAGPGVVIHGDGDQGRMTMRAASHTMVELPSDLLIHLGWDEGTELSVYAHDGELVFEAAE